MAGRDVTALLQRWNEGDEDAGRQVMALLYDEVRAIAGQEFQRERAGHTLQPTAIANEAYLRLAEASGMAASGRSHFLGITAKIIRRILVDHSRERSRRKRGGDQVRVDMDDELLDGVVVDLDFVDLDRAMKKLEKVDDLAVAIVELKFIGGLTVVEIADYLEIGTASVSRKWNYARAWLRTELEDD